MSVVLNILLYGLNYAPEPVGIGKYSGELARWLAARGHSVRVITAPPYFPAWQIAADGISGDFNTDVDIETLNSYR